MFVIYGMLVNYAAERSSGNVWNCSNAWCSFVDGDRRQRKRNTSRIHNMERTVEAGCGVEPDLSVRALGCCKQQQRWYEVQTVPFSNTPHSAFKEHHRGSQTWTKKKKEKAGKRAERLLIAWKVLFGQLHVPQAAFLVVQIPRNTTCLDRVALRDASIFTGVHQRTSASHYSAVS